MAGRIERALTIGDVVMVETMPCVACGTQHELSLEKSKFDRWQAGEHLQVAFPELTIDERELLISGTCSDCFDNMFKEE